ncbi:sialidase-4-like [Narcine bancroftii]|uniref:sialidase-4-like n=1 Tax=Narcine bancroftii TaxID=1343680 RepID=UPI0038315881
MSSGNIPPSTILFEKDETGTTYRIPALIYLPDTETLLAFAEERSSPKDEDAKMLVFRRGRVSGNKVEWEELKKIEESLLTDHRSMNPCPVYDSSTKKLFLFFIAIERNITEEYQLKKCDNRTHLYYLSTCDKASRWFGPIKLTDSIKSLKDSATFALGPGHGIQLQSGRLLLPAYAYRIDARKSSRWWCCRNCCFGCVCQTSPHSFAIYSDDHGENWSSGKLMDNLSGECQFVSLDKGQSEGPLYCNARTLESYRFQALSWDRGTSFQEERPIPCLVETSNGCHGSVVGFPASVLGRTEKSGASDGSISPDDSIDATYVFFCHPTDHKNRRDLGIYLSTAPQNPKSWSKPWVIHHGPSGYSDLAYIQQPESPSLACLYECGSQDYRETITFTLFTTQKLKDNIPPAQAW